MKKLKKKLIPLVSVILTLVSSHALAECSYVGGYETPDGTVETWYCDGAGGSAPDFYVDYVTFNDGSSEVHSYKNRR